MVDSHPVPGPRVCFLCGDENPHGLGVHFESEGDHVYLKMTPTGRLQGFPGIVHGGFVAMFLDEVIGTAVASAAGGVGVTRELNVEYLKPVRLEQSLIVEGWPTGPAGGHLFSGEGTLRTGEGTVLAQARGVFAVMNRKLAQRVLGYREEDLEADHPLRQPAK